MLHANFSRAYTRKLSMSSITMKLRNPRFNRLFLIFLLPCVSTLFIVSRVPNPSRGFRAEASTQARTNRSIKNFTGGEEIKMAKPMSKSKIVSHLADKVSNAEENGHNVLRRAVQTRGKRVQRWRFRQVCYPQHRSRGKGAPQSAYGP